MKTWWQHGVIYQIYPRSFMDSTGDGVGDLQGIINRLDYLVELGVDAVWISPFYPSPMADFGYDVADYTDVDPLFGDLATFDRLVAAMHERNLKLVIDWVPNHTSDEHAWFIESRQSKDNPKRDWYIWRDAKADGSLPNNWGAFFGGKAWQYDETTGQYYLHLFHVKQPDLNWRNPEVVEAMHDTLRFWLDRGVDGFRMDVVTFIIKHKDLLDNPPVEKSPFANFPELGQYENKYNINQPEVHAYLRDIRQVLEGYGAVSIGETWFSDPSEIAPYYGENFDELHIPFNFLLMKTDWNADAMRQTLQDYYSALPEGGQPNFVLGSHDEHRLATRYGVENHRAAGLLLLTLHGTPTLYYGDELGMVDLDIPFAQMVDPQGVGNNDPTLSRDPERTPMQWDSTPNAGFSAAGVQTWLPVNPNYLQGVHAAAQANDRHSTLNFYRTLLHLRRERAALHQGNITLLEDTPAEILAYTRQHEDQMLLIVINFGAAVRYLSLADFGVSSAKGVLSTTMLSVNVDGDTLTLIGHEAVILDVSG